jgi:hypothetical protein
MLSDFHNPWTIYNYVLDNHTVALSTIYYFLEGYCPNRYGAEFIASKLTFNNIDRWNLQYYTTKIAPIIEEIEIKALL